MHTFFKLLFIVSLFIVGLYSSSNQKDIIHFVKNNLIKNPMVKVMQVDILETSFLREPKGWEVYFINITLKIAKNLKENREVVIPQTIFTDGHFISPSLVNMKTGNKLEETMSIPLKTSVYNDKHLLIGNKNAKNKMVVFSDPQCPYCQKLIPKIFKAIKANPSKIAMYYYHFPLHNIHPVSTIISKIMIKEQMSGNIENIMKLYTLEIDAKETDVSRVLKKIKKDLNLKYNKEDFLTKEVEMELKHDLKVSVNSMVNSTPTIYINGQIDNTRVKYKELLK